MLLVYRMHISFYFFSQPSTPFFVGLFFFCSFVLRPNWIFFISWIFFFSYFFLSSQYFERTKCRIYVIIELYNLEHADKLPMYGFCLCVIINCFVGDCIWYILTAASIKKKNPVSLNIFFLCSLLLLNSKTDAIIRGDNNMWKWWVNVIALIIFYKFHLHLHHRIALKCDFNVFDWKLFILWSLYTFPFCFT